MGKHPIGGIGALSAFYCFSRRIHLFDVFMILASVFIVNRETREMPGQRNFIFRLARSIYRPVVFVSNDNYDP
jgi:hypothetical protein